MQQLEQTLTCWWSTYADDALAEGIVYQLREITGRSNSECFHTQLLFATNRRPVTKGGSVGSYEPPPHAITLVRLVRFSYMYSAS